MLKSVCHLSITVKSNLLAFNEMLQSPGSSSGREDVKPTRQRGKSVGATASKAASSLDMQSAYSGSESALSSIVNIVDGQISKNPNHLGAPKVLAKAKAAAAAANASGHKSSSSSKLNKAFNRFLHKPKSLISVDSVDSNEHHSSSHGSTLYPGQPNATVASNPELQSSGHTFEETKSEFPEHVLKVYKADQTFKYLLVHKETTAREVSCVNVSCVG